LNRFRDRLHFLPLYVCSPLHHSIRAAGVSVSTSSLSMALSGRTLPCVVEGQLQIDRLNLSEFLAGAYAICANPKLPSRRNYRSAGLDEFFPTSPRDFLRQ
jgi:hypothetical protein